VANNTGIGVEAARKPGSRPPAYWIFSPLILVSAWSFYWIASFAKTVSWWTVLMAFLALLASFAGPVCRALGLSKAALICAATVIGLYWTLTFYVLAGFMIANPLALIYFWPFIVLPVIISVATTISFARSAGIEWAFGCIGAGFALAVLAIALGPASKKRDTNWVRPLDPADLRSEMRTLSKCSQDFAVAHPDAGFPESLDQLTAQSATCSIGKLGAQQKGFTVTYELGSKDGDGRIATYSLKARETTPKGKDTSSIFTDESGIIWTRYDGPHGMGSTMALLQGENGISRVRGCLADAVSGTAMRFVGGKSETTVSDPQQIVRRCMGEEHFVGEHKLVYNGYGYDFAFTKAEDGKADGFTVAIRPEPYGVAGIRSFLAIETSDIPRKHFNQIVYATPQDRPATVNDPLALGLEVGLSFKLAKTENY